jgi:AcrR family transcriptional regulator
VQDVAERAGSGTGAIYRRWATKEALVADAIRAYEDADLPHTDDAIADHPLLDLLAELAPAMALHRATFGRDRADEAAVTDDVLALVEVVARASGTPPEVPLAE